MNTLLVLLAGLAAACLPVKSIADEIWFLGDEHPHAGEMMEETPDAVIIKFPKSQVQQIRRDKALETRQRHERHILWQDMGDSVVLTLPKEQIDSSDTEPSEKWRRPTEALHEVGEQESDSADQAFSITGRVVGKIISHGEPVAGCKVGLVSRGGEAGLISTLFAGKRSSANAPLFFQTVTDHEGKYALDGVVVGEYDVYWQVSNGTQWTRKLSERPNITVIAGATVNYPDIYAP